MKDRLKRLASKLKYKSPVGILQDVVGKIGIKPQPYVFYIEEPIDIMLPGYEVRELTKGDADALIKLPGVFFSKKDVVKEMQDGAHCLAAFSKGELVAYNWYRTDRCIYKGNRFDLKPGEAYGYATFTSLEHRGKGLAPFIRSQLHKKLKSMGIKRIYSISEKYNTQAIHFKEKIGAKAVAEGFFINFFGRPISIKKINPEKIREIKN